MTDYQKLKSIIDEIDVLISKKVTSESPNFKVWKTITERFLIKRYGELSYEYANFSQIAFALPFFNNRTPVNVCKEGLETVKAIFLTYLQEIDEENDSKTKKVSAVDSTYKQIFIVHGHDVKLKQSVARVVEKQNIEAIILSEKENKGRTIIEKFEDYSDVSGAICLFTADDLGKAKNDTTENARSRQNVVLETGYFMGKLGRDRVIILADKGIEMPSDLSGIVYTNTVSWKFELLKELKAIGYKVDLN